MLAAEILTGASERIRKAQGILDVLFSLLCCGAIDSLRPDTLPDLLTLAQNFLTGAQEALEGKSASPGTMPS